MNTETKHTLLDLREEVNAERDLEISVAKQDYLDTVTIARQTKKDTIKGIKRAYTTVYVERKADMIVEMNETAEVQED